MSGFNSGLERISIFPKAVNSSAGITSLVGNDSFAGCSYTAGNILVEEAEDILSPEAWTTIKEFIGKSNIYVSRNSDVSGFFYLSINVNSGENSGNALRVQVLRDGVLAWDQVVSQNATVVPQGIPTIGYSAYLLPLKVQIEESFVVRACRHGTFAYSSSLISVGSMIQETIE